MCIRDRGNTEHYYNNNRNYQSNNNNNNNRVSRPRVNFIRAEDNGQRRYTHQRRNSFHDYDNRQRNGEHNNPIYNQSRRSTSLEDRDRQPNHEPQFDHNTERQEPTQSFQTDIPVGPINSNDNDNLNRRRQ